MSLLKFVDWRYLYALYWLVFACLSVSAAQSPGYVLHPESVPFPWPGLMVLWALLALAVGVFYVILRPGVWETSWLRFGGALALSGALLMSCILTLVTDMPGLYYIPTSFALTTFSALTIIGLARAIAGVWSRGWQAP